MGSIPLPALHIQPPPQQENPLEQYSRLLQLKNQMQEAPLRQQALQQAVQGGELRNRETMNGLQEHDAVLQALQESGGDVRKALPKIMQVAPGAGATMQKSLLEWENADITKKTSIIKLNQEKTARLGQLAGSATDPASFQSAIQQATDEQLIDPQTAQQFAQQGYSPELVRNVQMRAQTAQQQLQQAADALKQQETTRHDKATEANTAATTASTNAYRQAELGQGEKRISIEKARLAFDQKKSGLTADGQPDPNAQAIATGHVVPEKISYLLARNPGLVDAVMKLDPSFDSSKAQAYPTTYREFTSTKPGTAGGALNAGGTALTHLKELSEMNTIESHIPGTPDYNAYMNKADTVSSELAKFYGDATIPAIASIKKTLTATLPGNRQAAIQTQAQSMGDKLDSFQQTWDNAAPSKAYQAPMPGISQKAMAARAALDPNYKASQTAPAAGSGGNVIRYKVVNGQLVAQ